MKGIYRTVRESGFKPFLTWQLVEGVGRFPDQQGNVVTTGRIIAAKRFQLTQEEANWLDEQLRIVHDTLLGKALARCGLSLDDLTTGGVDEDVIPQCHPLDLEELIRVTKTISDLPPILDPDKLKEIDA